MAVQRFKRTNGWTSILVLFVTSGTAIGAPPQLAEVLEAYEAFANKRPDISLRLTMHRQNFIADTSHGKPQTEVWNWARRGNEERLRYADGSPPDEAGRPLGLYDYYGTGAETRLLRNWDPGNPQKITPANQGTIQAAIYPRTGEYLGRATTLQILWSFSTTRDAEEWSLRDIASHAKSVHITETAAGIQLALSQFDLSYMHLGDSLTITLDPERAYRCTEVVQVSDGWEFPRENAAPEPNRLTITRTVKKFFDAPNEMVPQEMTSVTATTLSDRRRTNVVITISDLRTNLEVTDADFAFNFPEHALVRIDPPLSPQFRRVVIWGADGKPAQEIQSMDDIPPDPTSQEPVALPSNGGTGFGYLLLINLVVLGAILSGAYFWRKRNA